VISAAVVKLEAIEAGFDLCGIAAARAHPKLWRIESWIDGGRAGDMHYLRESLDERLDVTKVLPTARSVISLGCVYNTRAPLSIDTPPGHAFISRYAWGDDYHDVLKRRVRRLLERSEEHTSELQSRENLVCRLRVEKQHIEGQEDQVDEGQ